MIGCVVSILLDYRLRVNDARAELRYTDYNTA